jgi:tyrosyl-tRNA synthetase
MDLLLQQFISYERIISGLQEVSGEKYIMNKIKENIPLKFYWGTAPTGKIHIGYFVPFLKILDLLDAGCNVIILIADLHAVLDNMKSSFDTVELRSQYYEILIKTVINRLGGDISKLSFVKGTSFQLSKEFTLDMYKANTIVTVRDAQHSGAEVVKQTDNPIMTGLLYPVLQCLDFEYLKVDGFLGGIDQRKISMFAKELLPKLGYKRKQIHLFNKMVPGLRTKKNEINGDSKMSSSDNQTKIDLLDTNKNITKKINSTYCLEGDIIDNTLLIFVKMVLIPVLKKLTLNFDIIRDEKYGGNISYSNYDDIEKDFLEKKLYPVDFKNGVIQNLVIILEPIRKIFEENEELTILLKKAYS